MNAHEQAARFRKVNALLVVLLNLKTTADVARRMNAGVWALVAQAAKVRPPSDETIALVIADLERVEMGRAA